MVDRLRDRTVVITGAGSGIGAGIARGLATEGANVVLADLDERAATGVATEITDAGGSLQA